MVERNRRIDKSSLIYPLFVKEGTGIEEEIPSMEGQYRYSVDRLPYELERLQKAGVSNIMLFGIPDHKDEVGSGAYDENGIVQKALREAKKQFPDLYLYYRCVHVRIYFTWTLRCSLRS